MRKRVLSVLMTLCMVLTLVTPAMATEEGPVAQIGDETYNTLDAAVEAAADGATIELLADATTDGLELRKDLTIQAAEGLEQKPTVTFIQKGIALWGKNLAFKNIDVKMQGIGSTPYAEWSWQTICASSDASLTLDNVNMTMDATGTTNSPHAIYFCSNNALNIVNGSNLTIKNYANDALEWDGGNGGYNVNITDSTFVSDHNRSGFTGTFWVTATNSRVEVINSTGNGSNGSNFKFENCIGDGKGIAFNNNGSHGLSAAQLIIKNSVVTANDNGMYGITYTGKMEMDSTSQVYIYRNALESSGGGLRADNEGNTSTVEAGAVMEICDNGHNGLENYGSFAFKNGAKLTITGNDERTTNGGGIFNGPKGNLTLPENAVVTNNHAHQTGGGICNAGTATIPGSVKLYNNHAGNAGDDIYNRDNAAITFGPVGSDWALDGGQDKLDCNGASHAIDGWYDDSEGSRWNAHSVPTHVDEFTVGSAAVHDLLALKAAHDVIPLEPDDPDLPDYDAGHSKSKTATNLEKQEDGTYTSEVTLSLPSAQEELVTDVVFVLDKSTSAELEEQALKMLEDLKAQITETGAKVKVGVVIFNKVANVTDFMDLSTEYDKIETVIKQDISSGTNTHAGLLAGKAMLDEDTSVSADRKYLIFVSDGITYMYNEKPTAIGLQNADKTNVFAGPDNWTTKYGSNSGPTAGWGSWLVSIKSQIDADGATYEDDYDGGYESFITYDDRANHAMSIDKALYLTYQTYQEADELYHCYAIKATSNADHPWATSFMDYLANGQGFSFDDIQKDIYYLLDAGTKVEDYMGYVADDYNFDFVADGLTMKVGDQTYEAVPLEDNKYGFAQQENGDYAYTLTYVPGDQKGGEHFVWEINVPVSNFAPVQLTYTVKLVNPKTAEGTYGVYDKNGDGLNDETGEELTRNTGLYTNNSATLYPVDSNNTEGLPENFPKPTVSYTVAQETGTLTVQKIVADNVEDWSFDFAVTIGGNTQNVTLTKNSPTWTSRPIALGTEYEVKEVDAKGYQVTSTNETGTITENSSAVFVNMPVDTGVLTISKTVEGQKNPTEKFTFTVNLPEGEYPYIYSTAQGNDEVSGHISNNETVTLSSGQSVSIYGLPVGASYTVTETANDDYTVSAEAIHGTVDGAVVSGTIPDLEDGAAAAHYTNTYHGSWIPPVDPDPTPTPDPGDKPELNTEDHYAYIVGYEDGSVQPEGDITRAEVATIFFRLLTDESRDEFWSQTNPYSDVSEDDWYNNAVSTLTNAGIIDGYEDGTFKPNGNITRAEFATIAVRFFEATYEGENLFPDIDGHWAQDYINEAANAGIVDGYPDGTFGPQKLITRAEAMTMVNRTIDRHPHEDHLLDDMIVWPDNPETAWYYEQVQEATNSHEYTMHTDDEQNPYEIWTELLPNRDWSELEKAWSDANDGAGSGEVV